MLGGLGAVAAGLGLTADGIRRLAGPVGQSPWGFVAAMVGASFVRLLAGWLIWDARPRAWRGRGKR